MNWNLYFTTIKTQEDFHLLLSTGMAWELFPLAAADWQEHERLLADWNYGNWADNGR